MRQTNIVLAKNSLLEAIANTFSEKPDLDLFVHKFNRLPARFRTSKRWYDNPHTLLGVLAEYHVNQRISRFAARIKNVTYLNRKAQTRTYRFIVNYTGAITVLSRSRGQTPPQYKTIGDYDALFVADGLPTIVESKLKGAPSKGCQRVNSIINKDRNKLFHPLKEYFGKSPALYAGKFGFIIVTYPANLNPKAPVHHKFREDNGLLVPFYADRDKFYDDVLRILPRLKR
jgi:hypothetical protein